MTRGTAASRRKGAVGVSQRVNADAFGRLRVSEPDLLFDSQMEYDEQPFYWHTDTNEGGSISHRGDDSTLDLSVTETVGSRVIRQTKQFFPYRPGKSQLFDGTAVFGDHVNGVRYRFGYFDSYDGAFFERGPDGTLAFVIRKGGSDNRKVQSQWNRDKFDGKGPSGISLHSEKAQILALDMQWLGVGRVRFGFDIEGLWEAHEFRHANRVNTTYMRTANLPCRYEIEQVDGGSAASMQQICCAVSSEGGVEGYGIPFATSNGTTVLSVQNERPVISIRPKTAFKTLNNNVYIALEELSIWSELTSHWKLVYNGSLTDDEFNSVDDDSAMEYDVAATAIDGGTVIACGYATSAGSGLKKGGSLETALGRYPLTPNFDYSEANMLSVVMDTITGNGDAAAAFNWRELR